MRNTEKDVQDYCDPEQEANCVVPKTVMVCRFPWPLGPY